jgi:branched-chain amino acid transport system ATP-binding protein
VLVQGEVLVEGPPDTVRDDPRVIEAYLGKPREEVEAEVAEAAASAEHKEGNL